MNDLAPFCTICSATRERILAGNASDVCAAVGGSEDFIQHKTDCLGMWLLSLQKEHPETFGRLLELLASFQQQKSSE